MNSVANPFNRNELPKVNWWDRSNTEDYDFKAIHKAEEYVESKPSSNTNSEEEKVENTEFGEKHIPNEII